MRAKLRGQESEVLSWNEGGEAMPISRAGRDNKVVFQERRRATGKPDVRSTKVCYWQQWEAILHRGFKVKPGGDM